MTKEYLNFKRGVVSASNGDGVIIAHLMPNNCLKIEYTGESDERTTLGLAYMLIGWATLNGIEIIEAYPYHLSPCDNQNQGKLREKIFETLGFEKETVINEIVHMSKKII